MVYVTHDQVEAMTMADKIVVLSAGRIEQVGSPLELYHRPNNLFVATFIGSPKMNLVEASVTAVAAGVATLALPGRRIHHDTTAGQGGRARPGDARNPARASRHRSRRRHRHRLAGISGTVALSEHLGGETMLYIDAEGGRQLVVKTDGLASQKIGDRVPPSCRPRPAICSMPQVGRSSTGR